MNRFLFLLLSAVASLLPLASACTPTNTSTNSQFIIGTDGPADPATLGYTLNHVALQVQNITATRAFYGEVLGFRHVFTFVESDNYTITYMGYPSGGKNGTGYQTGEEMLREQRNTEGLIEFIWVRVRTRLVARLVLAPCYVACALPDCERPSISAP